MKIVHTELENLHSSVKKLIQIIPAISTRYYGCKCWLVGSAQHSPTPRDIDLVVEIPDTLFLAMYSNDSDNTIETWSKAVDNWEFTSYIWQQWSLDVAKQGKELTLMLKKQVDFKTQPESYFWSINKPKYQITK